MTEKMLHHSRFVRITDVVSEPTKWKWFCGLTTVSEAYWITLLQFIAHTSHDPPNSTMHFERGDMSVHLSSVHSSSEVHIKNEYT